MASVTDVLLRLIGRDQGASASVNKVANALNNLTRSYQNQARAAQQTNRSILSTANGYKGLVGQVASLNKAINVFGATIRQVGQGLQNLGTTVTAFISAPVALALRSATRAVLGFQDQLIEVRKNAGLTNAEIEVLRKELLAIAQETPTPLVDLAKIASDAARLGLAGDAIAGFTQVIDQLQVATTLTADEAGEQMGRLVNIFLGSAASGQEVVEWVRAVGSAINSLGQNIAGTEAEIISATLRAAPAAAALGIEIQDLIGITATLVETNASAERSGTQLNRALSLVASNAPDIASAFGLMDDEFQSIIQNNPVEAFLAIAEAIGNIENNVLRATLAEELFGQVGAKAVNILGETTDKLLENVALANLEFDKATSLQIEFARSMDSVQNQLGLLRNNFQVLAATIGEAVLPEITKLVTFAVPIVRILTTVFENASDRVKLLTVGFALLTAALGPLLYALGSLMFSIGIITTGLTTAMLQVFNLVTLPVRLAAGLIALINPFNLLIAVIVAAAAALLVFAGDLNALSAYISNLARNMYTWGANLMYSFANGIASAGQAVINTVVSILNTIASFLRAFSPPRAGPLKDIDKWGANIATTFADAFRNGDLRGITQFAGMIGEALEFGLRALSPENVSFFSDLLGEIDSALSSLGGSLGLEDDQIAAMIDGAANSLINLLNGIQNGADNLQSLFDNLRASLGNFGADFEKLIRLQLKFNSANEELEKIKDRIENIDEETDKRIREIAARTDLTAAQRAALIAQVKNQAAAEEEQLNDKKEAIEDELDLIKAQIDAQRDLISILKQLLGVNQDIADVGADIDSGSDAAGKPPKKPTGGSGSGSGSALSDLLSGGGGLAQGVSNVKDRLQELQDQLGGVKEDAESTFKTFAEKVADAEEAIYGFLAGLTGDWGWLEKAGDVGENFWKGFSAGFEIRQRVKTFLDTIYGYRDKVLSIGQSFQKGWKLALQSIKDGEITKKIDTAGMTDLEKQIYNIGYNIGTAKKEFDKFIKALDDSIPTEEDQTVFGYISEQVQGMFKRFQEAFDPDNSITEKLSAIVGPLSEIAKSLAAIAALTFEALPTFGEVMGTLAGLGVDGLLTIIGIVGAIASLINISAGFGDVDNLAKSIKVISPALYEFMGLDEIKITSIADAIQAFKDAVTGNESYSGFLDFIQTLKDTVTLGFVTSLTFFGVTIEQLQAAIELLGQKWTAAKESIKSLYSDFIEKDHSVPSGVIAILSGAIGGLAFGVGLLGGALSAGLTKIIEFVDTLERFDGISGLSIKDIAESMKALRESVVGSSFFGDIVSFYTELKAVATFGFLTTLFALGLSTNDIADAIESLKKVWDAAVDSAWAVYDWIKSFADREAQIPVISGLGKALGALALGAGAIYAVVAAGVVKLGEFVEWLSALDGIDSLSISDLGIALTKVKTAVEGTDAYQKLVDFLTKLGEILNIAFVAVIGFLGTSLSSVAEGIGNLKQQWPQFIEDAKALYDWVVDLVNIRDPDSKLIKIANGILSLANAIERLQKVRLPKGEEGDQAEESTGGLFNFLQGINLDQIGKDISESIGNFVDKYIQPAIDQYNNVLKLFGVTNEDVEKALSDLTEYLLEFLGFFGDDGQLLSAAEIVTEISDKFVLGLGAIGLVIQTFGLYLAEAARSIGEGLAVFVGFFVVFLVFMDRLGKYITSGSLTADVKAFFEEVKTGDGIISRFYDSIIAYKDTIVEFFKLFGTEYTKLDDFSGALDRLKSAISGLKESLDEIKVNVFLYHLEGLGFGPEAIEKVEAFIDLVDRFAAAIERLTSLQLQLSNMKAALTGGEFTNPLSGETQQLEGLFGPGGRFELDNESQALAGLLGSSSPFNFSTQLDSLREMGMDAGEAIRKGIQDGAFGPHPDDDTKRTAFWDTWISNDKKAIEASSPSQRSAREIGVPYFEGIVEGLKTGLSNGTAKIQEIITEFTNLIKEEIKVQFDTIEEYVEILNSLNEWVTSSTEQIESATLTYVEIIKKQIQTQFDTINEYIEILNSLNEWIAQNTEAIQASTTVFTDIIKNQISLTLNDIKPFDSIRTAFVSWVNGVVGNQNDSVYSHAASFAKSIVEKMASSVKANGSILNEAVISIVTSALRKAEQSAKERAAELYRPPAAPSEPDTGPRTLGVPILDKGAYDKNDSVTINRMEINIGGDWKPRDAEKLADLVAKRLGRKVALAKA